LQEVIHNPAHVSLLSYMYVSAMLDTKSRWLWYDSYWKICRL